MTEGPVNLDERRGMAALKATETRRQRLRDFQTDHADLMRRQEELEELLLAGPAETWTEAAAKALYLIQLFSATAEAHHPRRRQLITDTLRDLTALCDQSKEPS